MRRVSRRSTLAILAAVALFTSGCSVRANRTPVPAVQCAASHAPFERHVLYFGLTIPNSPGELVTPERWQEFSREVLSAHFPDGMTILDGHGEWRSPDGRHYREPTRLVIVLNTIDQRAETAAAVRAVIAEAKRRFAQEAVLWEQSVACAAF